MLNPIAGTRVSRWQLARTKKGIAVTSVPVGRWAVWTPVKTSTMKRRSTRRKRLRRTFPSAAGGTIAEAASQGADAPRGRGIMRAANWTIPVIVTASTLFYVGACYFMGAGLLVSPAGVVLSVVWWLAVVACCVAVFILNRRQ